MMLIVLITGGALGGYEALSVVQLERDATAKIAMQADVRTIVGATVDGTTCDALTTAGNGPSMSGALRAGSQITPLATEGKDIASYEVTPGFLQLIAQPDNTTNATKRTNSQRSGPSPTRRSLPTNNQADASGIWVSRNVAKDFGLRQGGTLETDHGTIEIAGVFSWPNDGRDTRPAYALIVPVSTSDGSFEECWAKQWPLTEQTDDLLYSTTHVSQTKQSHAGVTSLNKGMDPHYDATAAYRSRMTAWMPWAGLIIGLALGAVSVQRRKLEYAGALHIGQRKHEQVLGIAFETAVWAGLGTISAISIIALVASMAPSSRFTVLLGAARTPVALFAGIVLGAMITDIFIRESQLQRYFKSR